ncbi:MAG: phage virion morphogenesis protein [Kofleriaceae bacterium]
MIDAGLDVREIEASLRKLGRFGRDLRPVFREMRAVVLDDQRQHRMKQEGPEGRWAPRAASTVERYASTRRSNRRERLGGLKRRRQRLPARILGRLPSAIDVLMDNRRLRVESKVPWSSAHQDGDGRLPRRTFLWISTPLLRRIRDVMVKMAERAWP